MGTGYLYDVWVANYGAGTISKILNSVAQSPITVGINPFGICVDKDNVVWVTNSGSNTVSKIVSGVVVDTITVGANPRGICVDRDNAIWVANYGGNTVSKIVAGAIKTTVTVGTNPRGICSDKDGVVWVTNSGDNTVCKMVSGLVTSIIAVGSEPRAICVDKNNVVWATNYGSNTVSKIVAGSVTATITVGTQPYGICVDKDSVIWAINSGDNTVSKIVNNTAQTPINVDVTPAGICIDKDNIVWTANYGGNSISKVISSILNTNIIVGTGPVNLGDATGLQAAMLFGWVVDPIPVTINADAKRNVYSQQKINTDVIRKISTQQTINTDTNRIITDGIPVVINTDTIRKLSSMQTVNADTSRKLSNTIAVNTDTCRIIVDGAVPIIPFIINADTCRKFATSLRQKSINISIAPKTLSDKFNTVAYGNVNIDQLITGSIKDFDYIFKVSEVNEPDFNILNKTSSITGVYDIEDVLNKAVVYHLASIADVNAINIITAVATALGKTVNIRCDNHIPKHIPNRSTGREIISALFGWTDRLPQRQVNAFIRGNCINVIQRGHESGVLPLTKFANVSRNRKKILTLHDPLDTDSIVVNGTLAGEPTSDANDSSTYLRGTFTNGDVSITYVNGLVVSESHLVGGFREITTHDYSSSLPPSYLNKKTTITKDGKTVTTLSYQDDKLSTETEDEYNAENEIVKTRITRHYPIGQGMWGTSIEEDGVTTYGTISQGAPGGKASPYNINQGSKKPDSKRIPPFVVIDAKPFTKYMDGLPICDTATLQAIADAVVWLDKKIETRVSLESYDETIFDYHNRVLWCGQEYYLESNTITQDPDKFSQKVELVRWG